MRLSFSRENLLCLSFHTGIIPHPVCIAIYSDADMAADGMIGNMKGLDEKEFLGYCRGYGLKYQIIK